mmetsp:Transcript_25760/g.41389  ORF Transcript_25760/g.41389 Transcript_25760/m.41389 type:complete len:450 (-) Transcript_25760:32-1381(-)
MNIVEWARVEDALQKTTHLLDKVNQDGGEVGRSSKGGDCEHQDVNGSNRKAAQERCQGNNKPNEGKGETVVPDDIRPRKEESNGDDSERKNHGSSSTWEAMYTDLHGKGWLQEAHLSMTRLLRSGATNDDSGRLVRQVISTFVGLKSHPPWQYTDSHNSMLALLNILRASNTLLRLDEEAAGKHNNNSEEAAIAADDDTSGGGDDGREDGNDNVYAKDDHSGDKKNKETVQEGMTTMQRMGSQQLQQRQEKQQHYHSAQANLPSLQSFLNNVVRCLGAHQRSMTLLHAGLQDLPLSFSHLKWLTRLDLSFNMFETIPLPIFSIRPLSYINLSNNHLVSVPSQIEKLTGLENLYLSHNQITSLPESLTRLKKMKVLAIRNNKIAGLPEDVGDMSNLEELWAAFNKFKSLPASLWRLKKLKSIHIGGMNLRNQPKSLSLLELKQKGVKILY